MYDLQKANMWKRLSAALLDFILLCIVAVGVAVLLSGLFRYDTYAAQMEAGKEKYEALYQLDLDITAEDYEALSDAQKQRFSEANKAFSRDPDVNYAYGMMFNLSLLITTFAILAAYMIMEFLVPLLFKNGQTLGKKAFGIGVMRIDGVRITPLLLFARTVLGKYTVGTMIPVYIVLLIYFNAMGILGTVVIGALLLVQMILLFGSRYHTAIHDKLSQTVTVDFASQMIFDSPEELLAYKKRIHAEEISRQREGGREDT